MFRKMMCLVFAVFVLCLAVNIQSASAADQWFYTGPAGDQYYLRQGNGARAWRGGYVVRVSKSGEITDLFFLIEGFRDYPYHIHRGNNFNGPIIEKGTIYGNDHGNYKAPAQALCELIY